jgi:DNA-binding NarL/FixJ family response regulator
MNATKHITVLLADDHASVRHGLRTLLARDERIEVVGEARNGVEAVAMAQKLRPNVILMDVSMPLLNGLEATRRIMERRPSARVIVLSAHVDDEYVKRAREVGAFGYVAKQASSGALTSAIRQAAASRGQAGSARSASPFREEDGQDRLASPAADARGPLSSQESTLLRLVGEGSRKKQIASKLRISIGSAEHLLDALMAKLDIPRIASLAAYAVAIDEVESDVVLTIT